MNNPQRPPEIVLAKQGTSAACSRSIIYQSGPQEVSMGDQWFEMADLNHFWMVRRFEVLGKLCGQEFHSRLAAGEVGCGQGVLQRQLETAFGLEVDGFDLHLSALERSVATRGRLYYYDVNDRHPDFGGRYDLLFLFDVLEHIEDDRRFLESCLFHLKPAGRMVINVPARKELFSRYDTFAGHVRRYTLRELSHLAGASSLKVTRCTYWGLPLYPVLLLRKVLLPFFRGPSAFERGFVPAGRLADLILRTLSRMEILPQRMLGTSIMAVLQRAPS